MKIISTARSSLIAMAVLIAGGFAGSAHADALDDIIKAGVFKVGVFQDFPPFSSAGADMKLKGYDIDVAQILAERPSKSRSSSSASPARTAFPI